MCRGRRPTFLVDDAERHVPGTAVRVRLPAETLFLFPDEAVPPRAAGCRRRVPGGRPVDDSNHGET
jgi:hypothetical protein